MLADGTTGQPLPALTGCPPVAGAGATIRDKVKDWFSVNAESYRLDERGEKTRMYSDAANALSISPDTAKVYLSSLVNGKN